MSSKVVIIGVDGATPQLMEKWMDEGKLPTFQRLRKKGVWGKLRSTIPPFSAPSWASIVTGCNPGKHGIYGFETLTDVNPHLITSKNRKTPAFWKYLSTLNLKNIIVNVPGSYPPEKINGVMVTGLLTPSPDSKYTYPADLKNRLTKDDLGEYPLESIWLEDFSRSRLAETKPSKLVSILLNQLESRGKITLSLMKEMDWDVAMVVFRATDTAQHFLFDQLDHVLTIYQKVDMLTKQLLDAAPDATFFIVSDHGFERIRKILHPDNVLYKAGFLKPAHVPTNQVSQLSWNLFYKLGRVFLKRIPADFIKHSPMVKKILFSSAAKNKVFDFTETKAFSTAEGRGIQINLKPRYEEGIIEKKDYETVRADIISLFSSLTDPETGEKYVDQVYRGTEVYGDKATDPLDLVLSLTPHYTASESLRFPEKKTTKYIRNLQNFPVLFSNDSSGRSGDHAQHGIFFAYGSDIKQGEVVEGLSVFDVLPQVFASLGFQAPSIVDGRIKESVFRSSPRLKKINWTKNESKTGLTAAEKQKINMLHKHLQSRK